MSKRLDASWSKASSVAGGLGWNPSESVPARAISEGQTLVKLSAAAAGTGGTGAGPAAKKAAGGAGAGGWTGGWEAAAAAAASEVDQPPGASAGGGVQVGRPPPEASQADSEFDQPPTGAGASTGTDPCRTGWWTGGWAAAAAWEVEVDKVEVGLAAEAAGAAGVWASWAAACGGGACQWVSRPLPLPRIQLVRITPFPLMLIAPRASRRMLLSCARVGVWGSGFGV